MPIYHCHSPQRLLTESAKGKIAGEITRIHCRVLMSRGVSVEVSWHAQWSLFTMIFRGLGCFDRRERLKV